MKRKFLILICLILFFVSVAAVSAAEDVNQTIIEDNGLSVAQDDEIIADKIVPIIIDGINDNEFCNINSLDVYPKDFNTPYSYLLLWIIFFINKYRTKSITNVVIAKIIIIIIQAIITNTEIEPEITSS